MNLKTHAKQYLCELQDKWNALVTVPDIFAYQLSISAQKFLPGACAFYAELNMQRSRLRRAPQVIPKLQTAYDANKFNFNKIQNAEYLMHIKYEHSDIALIINKSPLTIYHMLICPEVQAGHAQQLTKLALSFSVTFLRNLDAQLVAFRIGYNSPGALASVNHLHLHLLHVDKDLYIDKVKLQLLASSYIYRLSPETPTEAICFLFHSTDSDDEVQTKIDELFAFVSWLCERSMPHNLFMTVTRDGIVVDALKVFVFARTNYCEIKDSTALNIGFCELSGFISVGDETIYDDLTEQLVLNRIRHETGDAYKDVYEYFTLSSRNNETIGNH